MTATLAQALAIAARLDAAANRAAGAALRQSADVSLSGDVNGCRRERDASRPAPGTDEGAAK